MDFHLSMNESKPKEVMGMVFELVKKIIFTKSSKKKNQNNEKQMELIKMNVP